MRSQRVLAAARAHPAAGRHRGVERLRAAEPRLELRGARPFPLQRRAVRLPGRGRPGARGILRPGSPTHRPPEATMATARGVRMEHVYYALAVIGFILPGVPMIRESIETGNWLFWANPSRTMSELFVN